MASLSAYLESALLNATLRNTSYTSPATVYIALYTSNPTAADTGTEVTGGSGPYARKTITWSAPSGGQVSNLADITWTGMPAAVVSHIGIRDALTAGNLLYFGALAVTKTVNSGDTFVVHTGDVVIQAS